MKVVGYPSGCVTQKTGVILYSTFGIEFTSIDNYFSFHIALAEVLSVKDINGLRLFYVHYIDCKYEYFPDSESPTFNANMF